MRRLLLALSLILAPSCCWASSTTLSLTWSFDCATPPGTIVGQIWQTGSSFNHLTFSYVGDSSFKLDPTGNYLIVGPGGILSADCNNATAITLQGAAPCALNLKFDWSQPCDVYSFLEG